MRPLLFVLPLLLLTSTAQTAATLSPSAVNLQRSDVPRDFRPVDLHDVAQRFVLRLLYKAPASKPKGLVATSAVLFARTDTPATYAEKPLIISSTVMLFINPTAAHADYRQDTMPLANVARIPVPGLRIGDEAALQYIALSPAFVFTSLTFREGRFLAIESLEGARLYGSYATHLARIVDGRMRQHGR